MESKHPKSEHLEGIEYLNSFKGTNTSTDETSKRKAALDRAWSNRDFEIDKYWSRATYFWAFIAATFAGYIAVSSGAMDAGLKRHLGFMINCMGIIFSTAWVMVNAGSKQWQENWEKHIDMLEDEVTGPIYKTVLDGRSYSVSKINKTVSIFVLIIWILLALRGLYTEFYQTAPVKSIRQAMYAAISTSKPEYHITVVITLVATLLCLLYMIARGKTKKSEDRDEFFFTRRDIEYKETKATPPPPAPPEQKPKNAKHS